MFNLCFLRLLLRTACLEYNCRSGSFCFSKTKYGKLESLMNATMCLCHQDVADALPHAVRYRYRKIPNILVYLLRILPWMHCKVMSINNFVMLMVPESTCVDDPCVCIHSSKAFCFPYEMASEVAPGPKVTKCLH